ncbi:Verru_Chthon cassette protein A [Verrucomicrobium sp. GAS474]|uniref:Verru_Chthon cassette protein A n=1 Tax=Verrucomicrobium sp. GAS474 TaxID=1882831 RepID=UPI00087A0A7C|nr:Verru_Chthon cassette protein A [Verrucomicrobium sp. GAS474]SDU02993.1 Verru_Chthon cassette protein A [Verrucomicrobium sp. GAS474]
MALLLVLSCLVLTASLAIAFLASISSERNSSKRYADGGAAGLLAQSAFNLAIAQITAATKGVDTAGKAVAWASQPGMIRTYSATGAAGQYFKLYSWDKMIGTGAFVPTATAEAVPLDWSARTALFTDLNAPMKIGGKTLYPIIDGNGLTAAGGGSLAYQSPTVKGFSVTGAPTASGASANVAPMPVKWLYVLADGTIAAPATGSGGTQAKISGASSSNPIVGRVAFWTDDESCKVNINTAASGTYWDTPTTSSLEDGNLGKYQPAQHEYQRYPGHPATTSLRTVFPTLSQEEIYALAPRVKGGTGTSMEGTTTASATITPDFDRLYADVDELLFKPAVTGGERGTNNSTVLNQDTLPRFRFFLTASSRSPEVNLFNLPRVSIWPEYLNLDATHTSAFDRLIAFCSTIGGNLFYFQRSNPQSPTSDLPAAKASTGLGRNRALLEYLRGLTSREIPGFGGNFETKYGTKDRNQILTEIFDYIRSTNLLDPTAAIPFAPSLVGGANKAGQGQVVPIEDTQTATRGFGRFPTLQGATIVFVGARDTDATKTGQTAVPPRSDQIAVRAFLIPQFYDPSLGHPYLCPNFSYRISGLDTFRWTGVDSTGAATPPVGMFTQTNTGKIDMKPSNGYTIWGDNGYGGSVGAMEAAYGQYTPTFLSNAINMLHPRPPGASADIAPAPTFVFSGGTVTVEILAPDGTTVCQSLQLAFPSGTLPVPHLAGENGTIIYRNLSSSTSRFQGTGNAVLVSWITSADVVRSIVPAVGDLRLVSPRKTLLASDADYSKLFAPHSAYADSTTAYAHNLRNGNNTPYYHATGGRLLPLSYASYAAVYLSGYELNPAIGNNPGMNSAFPRDSSTVPDNFTSGVALGKNGAATAADLQADWDNGVAYRADGPYINRPDEGDSSSPPYYVTGNVNVNTTLFSPNRMMPSAVMFGSLPTGVWAGLPWQTLEFRPGPLGHPGLAAPKDHLLLDLFTMPVVEPYAISEPFSAAGRINMNYQIVPFTYLRRDTGVRAVLEGEKVIAISDGNVSQYKLQGNGSQNVTVRYDVDPDETLKGFEQRFAANDLFRSASEICDIQIVPQGGRYDTMETYWKSHRLTGDNSRERPYATIYPRLTTKSNTYTVHARVQVLQKRTGSDPTTWSDGRDLVVGEYRGSETVERYVDPATKALPDYADLTVTTPLSQFYKTRVVAVKKFAP